MRQERKEQVHLSKAIAIIWGLLGIFGKIRCFVGLFKANI